MPTRTLSRSSSRLRFIIAGNSVGPSLPVRDRVEQNEDCRDVGQLPVAQVAVADARDRRVEAREVEQDELVVATQLGQIPSISAGTRALRRHPPDQGKRRVELLWTQLCRAGAEARDRWPPPLQGRSPGQRSARGRVRACSNASGVTTLAPAEKGRGRERRVPQPHQLADQQGDRSVLGRPRLGPAPFLQCGPDRSLRSSASSRATAACGMPAVTARRASSLSMWATHSSSSVDGQVFALGSGGSCLLVSGSLGRQQRRHVRCRRIVVHRQQIRLAHKQPQEQGLPRAELTDHTDRDRTFGELAQRLHVSASRVTASRSASVPGPVGSRNAAARTSSANARGREISSISVGHRECVSM